MAWSTKEPIAQPWNPDVLTTKRCYAPLHVVWPHRALEWPSCQALNEHYRQIIQAPCYRWYQFIPQASAQGMFERYEALAYFQRRVLTREHHWHDFFNYLTYLQWPKSKDALIARTMKEYLLRPGAKFKQRSNVQNRLALFDECGAVIVAPKKACDWIRAHQWIPLFVDHRDWFESKIQVHIFGHAIYEKFLNPYIGMTVNALLVERETQCTVDVDALLKARLDDPSAFLKKGDLNPFPILGVPGLHPNEAPSFYEDTSYFR